MFAVERAANRDGASAFGISLVPHRPLARRLVTALRGQHRATAPGRSVFTPLQWGGCTLLLTFPRELLQVVEKNMVEAGGVGLKIPIENREVIDLIIAYTA